MSAQYPTAKIWIHALAQSIGATSVVYIILAGFTLIFHTTSLIHLITLPFFIWVISILICGFGVLLERRNQHTTTPALRPVLYARLKPALRQSVIYALCAQDHYVRVITSDGEDLILTRLSDAINETAPLIGISTHRS